VQEWTVGTVLAHILALRESDILRIEQRFIAQERAVEKALAVNDQRFANTNEWRTTVAERNASYITRNEVYSLVAAAGVIGGLIGRFLR